MNNKKTYLSCLLLITFLGAFLMGCSKADPQSDTSDVSAQIQIRDVLKRTSTTDRPMIKATVQNRGTLTAFNLAATINVMNDSTVLERVAGDFSQDLAPADLESMAIALMVATFNVVDSHADYTHLDFNFSWREARSQGAVQSIQVLSVEMEDDLPF